MHRLNCKAQNYAWGPLGLNSLVAQLLAAQGRSDIKPDTPYSELWMGTHPSAPSTVIAQEQLQHGVPNNLKDLLPPNTDLPYLFKVLSILKPLSIQAHPDKKLAERLHSQDPEHYPDDNHKPELVVALTDFTALCCFRKPSEINFFLKLVPEFSEAVGKEAASAFSAGVEKANAKDETAAEASADAKALLKPFFASIYATPDDKCKALQEALVARFESDALNFAHLPDFAHAAFAAFKQCYKFFPGDVGCWMVFVLNVVHLKPGAGLFLAANEPHAYIQGDCVEVMAASDNVIRAGLTPKFKDVNTLVESLTYRTDSLSAAHFDENTVDYVPPEVIPEFRLQRVFVAVKKADDSNNSKRQLNGPAIAVVISGAGALKCTGAKSDQTTQIKRGDILALIPPDVTSVELSSAEDAAEPLLVFIATERNSGGSGSSGSESKL